MEVDYYSGNLFYSEIIDGVVLGNRISVSSSNSFPKSGSYQLYYYFSSNDYLNVDPDDYLSTSLTVEIVFE